MKIDPQRCLEVDCCPPCSADAAGDLRKSFCYGYQAKWQKYLENILGDQSPRWDASRYMSRALGKPLYMQPHGRLRDYQWFRTGKSAMSHALRTTIRNVQDGKSEGIQGKLNCTISQMSNSVALLQGTWCRRSRHKTGVWDFPCMWLKHQGSERAFTEVTTRGTHKTFTFSDT